MLDNLINFFKKMNKKEEETELLPSSSDAAKERLHLVLMQDRVNVSVDFMDMMNFPLPSLRATTKLPRAIQETSGTARETLFALWDLTRSRPIPS